MRLGKLPATPPRAHHLSRYLGSALAEPPQSYDRSEVVTRWGMLDNDTIGDCTIAAVGHYIDLVTASAGDPRHMTAGEALAGYEAFGYDPAQTQPDGSNPTDQGCNVQDVLQHWIGAGFQAAGALDRIDGYASITPTDDGELRFATWKLAGVYLGIELPLGVQPSFAYPADEWDLPPGQNLSGPWAPGSLGGHAILGVGYDSAGIVFISWGQRYRMSWRFWHAYAAESYAILDRDLCAGPMPLGSWAQLEADMAELRAA